MAALLDGIDYDFGQFTMADFRRWLERRRGREIVLIPHRIASPTVSGAWLAGVERDFLFYAANASPIHQAHIQLHELAHMVCGHATLELPDGRIGLTFRRAIGLDGAAALGALLMRSSHSDAEEIEAETLASLIQGRVLRHGRLRKLTQASAGDFAHFLSRFLHGLELET